jgi:predicted Zn-dependent protease
LELAAGEYDASLSALRKALEFAPEEPVLRTALAWTLRGLGEDAAALEELERVTRTDPSDVPAWRAIVLWRLEAGDAEAALRAAEAGLAHAPQDAELLELREDAAREIEVAR